MKQQKHESSLPMQDLHFSRDASAKDGLSFLRLAAGGATNREIAEQLGCSERTVKRKIEQVAARLGAKNRTQAVAIAIRTGLI